MLLEIKRGLDLRLTHEERQFYARPGTLVVLVNNRHTIAFGVLAEDPDLIIRAKLPSYLKGTSDHYLTKWLNNKFFWLLERKVMTFPEPLVREVDFVNRRSYNWYQRKRASR